MKLRPIPKSAGLCAAATISATLPSSFAQDALQTLEPLTVVGSREAAFEMPGSAAFVEASEFRERGYTNLAQITAKVPGVYVRSEDGFGNFPNISLRGVDGNRSTKVTMMEDGILTAPAPYSAPSAYYAPKAARMAGIEFLKGSSQVKYGPQTTGGVVNYLSTGFTEDEGPSFYNRTTFGSYNTLFEHAWYGDTQDTAAGKIGWLLELHGEHSDGYRDIDGSSKDTGYDLIEPMLKMFWEPNTALKQRLEFKVGFSSFDANETYTGLTDADFDRDPDRRYASTLNDEFTSEQWRTYLKWIAEPSDALRLESAVYLNTFRRNWDKLSSVDLSATGSTITNVAEAMQTPDGIALLKGLGIGNITATDAFRDHESYGWQNQANYQFDTGAAKHDLAFGLRLHYDQQSGTDVKTTYASTGTGSFNQSGQTPATPITRQEAFATAIYVEDSISIGNLTLRPGLRYEWLELESSAPAAASQSLDEHLIMGGLGANYDFDDSNSIFGGVYQGASPANPSGYAAGTDSEESLGFELGLRHQNEGLRAELVGFFTDFDQLIAPEIPGGAGTIPSLNGGSAEVWGIESIVEYDHGRASNWSFGLPVYASATFTNAEFAGMNGVLAPNAGTFAGGRNGNEIPYIPEWKLATGIGLISQKWGVNLDASYISTSWGTGYNDDSRPPGSNASAMDGKIDALLVFDLTGYYQVTDEIKLVGGIQNLFDERAIISRAPLGARGNAPQMIFAGFEAQF
jgi:Fe(3+) dicitrate transport protein